MGGMKMTFFAGTILDLVGNTPILEPKNYSASHNLQGHLLLKLEYFNPGGSIKDRVGIAMIEAAEKSGLIKKDTVIIEPTSGNTGVGLAMAAAAKGYKLILTMPETMSVERRRLLAALGAQLELTPGADGMKGSIDKALQLAAELPSAFIPQQFENPANPQIHYRTTAEEIWRDTKGKIDILVACVGTGGTITGCGRKLKEYNPHLQIVAVEPADSPLLSGGKAGPHKIQGIGANFIPPIVDITLFDSIATITTDDAYAASRQLAQKEGLLVGISSGAATFIATKLAALPENKDKNIVAILPDGGERYLSTDLFFAE
jgi:cysteine synthase A